MAVKVENKITVYEVDDEEVAIDKDVELTVRSHWNRDELVLLEWPDGKTLTVSASSLEAAIKNATNTATYR